MFGGVKSVVETVSTLNESRKIRDVITPSWRNLIQT